MRTRKVACDLRAGGGGVTGGGSSWGSYRPWGFDLPMPCLSCRETQFSCFGHKTLPCWPPRRSLGRWQTLYPLSPPRRPTTTFKTSAP